LELPIDHFKLIGVSPSAKSEEILRLFQLRLDREPDQGFTPEVLSQRAELLRRTADLLTDEVSRKDYESQMLKGASCLELSSNRAVAGLILLWEAGYPYEAFKLTKKLLQPPQTPALGSGRESDLILLAALTCNDAAIKEEEQRKYALASDLLTEGIQLLQRMGKLSQFRKELEEEFRYLIPFRILDLLSRNVNDDFPSHQKGLILLEKFINKRGGIEGKARSKKSIEDNFTQEDFEIFFQQIRSFLSGKEQIDLFLNLYKRGSDEAGILAFQSLLAFGVSRRYPEKLIEARKLLKGLNFVNLDVMPLQGCVDLLLGDIKRAEARFNSTSDETLRSWLENFPGEKLEAIFVYCQNWISNNVINLYRDIDEESINLEGWFSDESVQAFIEKGDKKTNRYLSRRSLGLSSKSIEKDNQTLIPNDSIADQLQDLQLPGGERDKNNWEDNIEQLKEFNENYLINSLKVSKNYFKKNYELLSSKYSSQSHFNKLFFKCLLAFAILFGIGSLIGVLRTKYNKITDQQNFDIIKNIKPQIDNKIIDETKDLASKLDKFKIEQKEEKIILEKLVSLSPNETDLEILLNSWLKAKSYILAGDNVDGLNNIIKPKLIQRLNKERDQDKNKGQKQIIKAEISSIKIINRTSSRIEVLTSLLYQDQRIDNSDKVISETSLPNLKVKYILGFDKGSWKLVDYVSGV
tara:strand:- start:1408 stop:3486 length:2079 start_codon:yes stop_codon:yes gene_type:complete